MRRRNFCDAQKRDTISSLLSIVDNAFPSRITNFDDFDHGYVSLADLSGGQLPVGVDETATISESRFHRRLRVSNPRWRKEDDLEFLSLLLLLLLLLSTLWWSRKTPYRA